MGKKGRSRRGLSYAQAVVDHGARWRMIVDELLESTQLPKIKIRNGGGHQYQRRHLDLIAYQNHAYHGDPCTWGRGTYYADGQGNTTVYLDGDYVGKSWGGMETYSLPLVNGLRGWVNDIHFGDKAGIDRQREQLSASVLSMKHLSVDPKFQPKTPKADIQWLGSESDLFMEALGHRLHVQSDPFQQLSLKDLASANWTDKALESTDAVLMITGQRMRMSGKSLSLNSSAIQAMANRRWFDENLKFKLQPYQQEMLDAVITKAPRGHLAFY